MARRPPVRFDDAAVSETGDQQQSRATKGRRSEPLTAARLRPIEFHDGRGRPVTAGLFATALQASHRQPSKRKRGGTARPRSNETSGQTAVARHALSE
jgi:hypothetical protein